MIVHGFVITDALQARLIHHLCRLGTFRNSDLIAAIRDQAAQDISKCITLGQISARRADVGEICMRGADVMIKLLKKRGMIRQGTKRGDWVIKTVEAEETWKPRSGQKQ